MILLWSQQFCIQRLLNLYLPFPPLFYKSILYWESVSKTRIYFPALGRLRGRNNGILENGDYVMMRIILIVKAMWDTGWGVAWVECECNLVRSSKGIFQSCFSCHLAAKALSLSSTVKNKFWLLRQLCSTLVTYLEPDILECEIKWALGSITMNKANGGDGIPDELFQILKDDTVKVLYSICQQIWKTQQ